MKRRYRRRFFTSLSLVTRIRYEQRSHRLNAVCSQLRVQRSVLKSCKQREAEKIVLYVRRFAERVRFAKQVSVIYYNRAKINSLNFPIFSPDIKDVKYRYKRDHNE